MPLTSTVIIVTMNRPDCIRKCLGCLDEQTLKPTQIIVVDSSTDSLTCEAVSAYPGVLYLKNDRGLGHTTLSRNIAVANSVGEVLAFIDDDAYPRTDWLQELLQTYESTGVSVGAVGGRALRHIAGEETEYADQIGKITKNGEIIGGYAVDCGTVIEVDHLIGCNMSFRRETLARCGGFRDGFTGPSCFREETDIFFVMKKLGLRILYNPAAVVDHLGAPKPKGFRHDFQNLHYAERNQYVLLIRNYGPFTAIVWRYLLASLGRTAKRVIRNIYDSLALMTVRTTGTIHGFCAGTFLWIKQGKNPMRTDAQGEDITRALNLRTSAIHHEAPRPQYYTQEPSD